VLLVAAAAGRLKCGCAVGVITFYKAQVTFPFPSPFSFLFNLAAPTQPGRVAPDSPFACPLALASRNIWFSAVLFRV